MRTYRATWGTITVAAAVLSAGAGIIEVGPSSVIAAGLLVAMMGATLGLAWTETDHRWRLVAQWGLWAGVGGVLLVGLPLVLGPWSLPALVALAGGCPPVVERSLVLYRDRHPVGGPAQHLERVDDRALERRWHQTSQQLQHPSTTPTETLRLVQERARLLDEIERRDPAEFAAALVRAGWRGADSSADL
ncbi:hypothetical protein [Nocardioides mangrovi]|uniref:Uncharacterized protein n=1 Tax=Nocardioides mangrovi TaxID=2874580 RepID=A0ABS7U7V2_9ACTN|nr:hypothetical protein [Nocardioides mangrovi]MBZ5736965.1 hypothetical protein [Nocardioides mangrovi]